MDAPPQARALTAIPNELFMFEKLPDWIVNTSVRLAVLSTGTYQEDAQKFMECVDDLLGLPFVVDTPFIAGAIMGVQTPVIILSRKIIMLCKLAIMFCSKAPMVTSDSVTNTTNAMIETQDRLEQEFTKAMKVLYARVLDEGATAPAGLVTELYDVAKKHEMQLVAANIEALKNLLPHATQERLDTKHENLMFHVGEARTDTHAAILGRAPSKIDTSTFQTYADAFCSEHATAVEKAILFARPVDQQNVMWSSGAIINCVGGRVEEFCKANACNGQIPRLTDLVAYAALLSNVKLHDPPAGLYRLSRFEVEAAMKDVPRLIKLHLAPDDVNYGTRFVHLVRAYKIAGRNSLSEVLVNSSRSKKEKMKRKK